MIFNDRRALKAANSPSLAPKKYKTDAEGRAKVTDIAEGNSNHSDAINLMASRKKRFNSAAIRADRYGVANSNDPWTSKSNRERK
jgi:hypothetical protein